MNLKADAGHSRDEAGWLEESARVVAIFPGGAWVETQPSPGCDGCTARQGCASGLLARLRRTPRLALHTNERLYVGERVRIGLPAERFLQGALIVYGWPLLMAIAAGGLTERLSAAGHISVPLAFVGGLALGLFASHVQLRRQQGHYRPCLLFIERAFDGI